MQTDDLAVPEEVAEEEDTNRAITAAKILVVDDAPANLFATRAALEPLARAVVTADSGERALACLLEHDFALALIDVNMPEMTGYELARVIRDRERTQHLPIIFMTAHSQGESSVQRAYALGAVDVLFCPVPGDVLRAKAAVFVTLHERTEQLALERFERDREHAVNRELNRLNAALAEHDRRKDSFIAILAHELRNPLAALRTCIDLIRACPDEAPAPRVVGALDRQTNVLVRLVDDLLDVSRIKADKIELRPEPLDLAGIVNSAVATCRPMVDERQHAIVVEGPPRATKVIGDPVRLAQVLCNLVNNAARYTPRGGRIEVTVTSTHDRGVVRIRDTGIGIPAELQHTIFSMFVQERVRSDGSGGLGLGLALAKRLVEMHNGTISVHSDGRGKGSTFEITLPREGSSLAIPVHKRTRDITEPPSRATGQPRIVRTVIVDDNDDARDLIAQLLRTKGYEVLTAADGREGVDLIREARPDVALVDLGLPKLDGFAVVELLRRECPDLHTRLVALTGYGEASDRDRTRRAGFHAHLVKPASATTLFACLARQLVG